MEKVVSDKLTYSENNILGKGSNGFVFSGYFDDTVSKIPIAVKRVRLASTKKEAVQKRDEDAMKGLDHPNVIRFLHVDQDDSFRFFVLELCSASLDQYFLKDNDPKKYKGPMPNDQQVLLQLTIGLEYIHSKCLVHRDIKPENILISKTEPVLLKLADFGLCKPANSVNSRSTYSLNGIKGSQFWTAPEILALGDPPSKDDESPDSVRGTIQSDIFSLGLVFFNYLTNGQHLYGSRNLITANIMRGKPVQLSKLRADHFAYDVVCKMTKFKPEERTTLSEVIKTLHSQVDIMTGS